MCVIAIVIVYLNICIHDLLYVIMISSVLSLYKSDSVAIECNLVGLDKLMTTQVSTNPPAFRLHNFKGELRRVQLVISAVSRERCDLLVSGMRQMGMDQTWDQNRCCPPVKAPETSYFLCWFLLNNKGLSDIIPTYSNSSMGCPNRTYNLSVTY